MVELPQQQPLMGSQPSNSRKVMAKEPRVAQVRHAADVDSLTLQENAQHGASIVTNVEIKIILVHVKGPRTEDSQDRDQHRLTHRESWSKRRSRSRHRSYASEDSEDRSTSRSSTQSAQRIELKSFQDHPELHESHSFQDHQENNDFVKKTFHTIYRSKLVASISNETDPEGKTKILTILNIKLPHQNGIDNV